jgi:hypothetical protein
MALLHHAAVKRIAGGQSSPVSESLPWNLILVALAA